MWFVLRRSSERSPDYALSVRELLQSTFRALIVSTGAVYTVWYLATAGRSPGVFAQDYFLVTVTVVTTCGLAFWLATKGLIAAQVIWQAGLAASIALAGAIAGRAEVAFLYMLLPLMAVITVGWPAGLVSEGLVAALVWWFSSGRAPFLVPGAYLGPVLVGGAFSGLLGWAALRTMLTAIQWYLFSAEQAQAKMEEARMHRAEVVRVLKELEQANHRLERANHMLVLARAEAEEAHEARNRFALAVSHELRTPLNFILGFSELMVNAPETYAPLERWPGGLYEDVEEIYHSTHHLMHLVNDILDLGQIEALRMRLLKEWVPVAEVVEEVASMVRPAFARKGLSLTLHLPEGLPRLYIDRTRVRQVLLNLVANGLRFTERGSVTIRVTQEGDGATFCVRDTGPGIPKEDISKVFEEFRHVGDSSWRRREGAGLGIPISRRFVELHGGRMWVESELGRGTSFYFNIPLPGKGRAPAEATGEADAQSWRWRKQRAESEQVVLALSPDPAAGEVLSRYVEGVRVVAVGDPDELRDRVAHLLPAALLVDRVCAGDGALQTTIEALGYDLPTITFAFPGSIGRGGLPTGVCDYLVKPVSRRALLGALKGLGPGLRHLLVVDDDPAMVRYIARVLESAQGLPRLGDGLRVTTALTGREALERMRDERPDAVLLDLALPDISGWDVLAQLRRNPQWEALPVIMVTAHDWPQMAVAEGGDTLRVTMRRPLSRHELTVVLKCLLETIRPRFPTLPAAPAPAASPPG